MADLKPGQSLSQLQRYVRAAATKRGFDSETIPQKFMLMQEELGEAAKAVRKISGIKLHEASKPRKVEDEFADLLFLILDISNKLNIDLEKAFFNKEEVNSQRTWG